MRYLAYCAALLVAASCGGDDGDGAGADAGASDAVTSSSDAAAQGQVPTTAAAMFSYLQSGDYTAYASESTVHPSAGPHGAGGVRTYINGALDSSLAAANTEHPVGAAAIKEFYAADGTTVSGWAAMVKTDAGAGGATWYFYEVFSTTNGNSPIEGNGNTICTGCHGSGADFVRVAYPLL